MLKKIGIGLGAIVIIIAAISWYVFSNLDSIVKAEIEKYGSAAAQAPVTVSSVKLSLGTGEGEISGLNVGNPNGYSSGSALALGSISVKLDTSSISGGGPIVVKEINVSQPQVNYEAGGAGGSNLQTLQKNAMAYVGPSTSPARKEIIDELYVRDGKINVSAEVLKGKSFAVPLPTLHLTNIGKDSGGATPAQIAEKVLSAITSEASKVASSALAQQAESMVGGAISGATDSAGGIGGQLKGLMGK